MAEQVTDKMTVRNTKQELLAALEQSQGAFAGLEEKYAKLVLLHDQKLEAWNRACREAARLKIAMEQLEDQLKKEQATTVLWSQHEAIARAKLDAVRNLVLDAVACAMKNRST